MNRHSTPNSLSPIVPAPNWEHNTESIQSLLLELAAQTVRIYRVAGVKIIPDQTRFAFLFYISS